LDLASELCQTVGDELLFLLDISFSKLAEHKIQNKNTLDDADVIHLEECKESDTRRLEGRG
jgi:hypothetical protein